MLTLMTTALVTGFAPPLQSRRAVEVSVRTGVQPRMGALPASALLAAADFSSAMVEAPAADGGSAVGSVLSLLAVGLVASQLLLGGDSEKATDANDASGKPSAKFGWLHADHRVPLPTLQELEAGCHLVGNWNGKQMFLCKAGAEDAHLNGCEVNSDFSTFYGEPVLVCVGGPEHKRFKDY